MHYATRSVKAQAWIGGLAVVVALLVAPIYALSQG